MLARLIAEAKLGRDKNYEKKISEKSINKKKIKTKSHGGLGACPMDKNVNTAKSSSRRLRHSQSKGKSEEWSMEQPNDIFLERWTARAIAWRDRLPIDSLWSLRRRGF